MVTDHYSLVELVLGISFTLWGVTILINKNILTSFVKLFLSDDQEFEGISYLIATMFLILGIIIVCVHNDWYMGLSLITTVLGWILVLKCFLWLAFREFLKIKMKKMLPILLNEWMNLSYGLSLIILGIATLWNHFYFPI